MKHLRKFNEGQQYNDITRNKLYDFCTDIVPNHFMTKATPEEQKEVDNFLNNNIVSDDLLRLYVTWELEVWGDMIKDQPIVFDFEGKMILGSIDYNNDESNIKIEF